MEVDKICLAAEQPHVRLGEQPEVGFCGDVNEVLVYSIKSKWANWNTFLQ